MIANPIIAILLISSYICVQTNSNCIASEMRASNLQLLINYRTHPKDGEGNIFSLFVSSHLWGGGGFTPCPSDNTSTGPLSFPGVIKVTGPMSLLGDTLARSRWGVPQPGPDIGVPHPGMVHPQPGQDGGTPARDGVPPG